MKKYNFMHLKEENPFKMNGIIFFFQKIKKIIQMKKVNKQCLLDTPRTVRVSEKTWQVIVRTS